MADQGLIVKHLLVVFVGLSTLVGVTSCGSDHKAEKRLQPQQAAGQPSNASKTRPRGKHSRPRGKVRGTTARPRVERYLRENFGGARGPKATWYDNIKGVETSDGTTTIRTNLRGADADNLAHQICGSVIGSLPGITDVVRITGPPGAGTLGKCVP